VTVPSVEEDCAETWTLEDADARIGPRRDRSRTNGAGRSVKRVCDLYVTYRFEKWSGRLDSNQRPPAPKAGALPDCATPRHANSKADSTIAFPRLGTPDSSVYPDQPRLAWPGTGALFASYVARNEVSRSQVPQALRNFGRKRHRSGSGSARVCNTWRGAAPRRAQ
jgi:hypothetical protein